MGNPIGVPWLGDDATVDAGRRYTRCDAYTYIYINGTATPNASIDK